MENLKIQLIGWGLMLDLHRLRVLQAVARAGSLSGAARELDYTQPAISHHIARLEEEVGTALLLRTARGMRLTEAGGALVEHADDLLTRLAVAEQEVAEIAALTAGRVRLAAFPSASATLVPEAARVLKDAHAGVSVSLVELEPPEALELLRAGTVDIAIGFDYPEARIAPTRELEVVPLLEDPLRIVTTRPRGKRAVALETLAEETWIAGCERCRSHLLHLAARAGFEPRIAFATDDYVTVQALVAAGLGVALLPSLALAAVRREDVAVAPLREPSIRRVVAVLPAGPRRPPAVAHMLVALTASAGDY